MAKNLSLGRILALMPQCCNHNRITALEQTIGDEGKEIEEKFKQVYTTTLSEASDGNSLFITSTDINGVYEDIVVFVDFPGFDIDHVEYCKELMAIFYADAESQYQISSCILPLTQEDEQHPSHLSFSFSSNGGLYYVSGITLEEDTSSFLPYSISGFDPNWGNSRQYPTETISGVASIELGLTNGSSSAVLPVNTVITVYARKAVQTNNNE